MDIKSNDETDLIEILKKIYKSKIYIIIISFSFGLIGVAKALLSPITYTSETIFITQNQESNSSNLSGVASLVGINLGSSYTGRDIPSSMYPQIGESPKFKRLLLNESIDLDNKINLKQYLIDYYNLNAESDKINSDVFISELENDCNWSIVRYLIEDIINLHDHPKTCTTIDYSGKIMTEKNYSLTKP